MCIVYSENSTSEVIRVSVSAAGDTLLKNTLPQAEYMYGCVATAVGMLLGYYDLYGYTVGGIKYNFSNLIPGTISIKSRGNGDGDIYDMSDSSVLANFIASEEYVDRFYDKSSSHEKNYTYVNGDPEQGLNISQWNCLADYLGTGQYWRASSDLSTQYYYQNVDWLLTTSQTYKVSGEDIPAKYVDFKYGLYLYVDSVGYALDTEQTRTYRIEDFTFDMYMKEIDADRPVLLSMKSGSYGHMVIGYGYNESTQEVIFDDTYRNNCRMKWDGTYEYSNKDYSLSGAATVIFSVGAGSMKPDLQIDNVKLSSSAGSGIISNAVPFGDKLYLSARIKNTGNASTTKSFYVRIYVDDVIYRHFEVDQIIGAGASHDLVDVLVIENAVEIGDHTWKIQVDSLEDIEESNEGNNIITGDFFVTDAYGYRVIKDQSLHIAANQTSAYLCVQKGGKIYNSGTVNNMILSSGAIAYVSKGATAANVTVSPYGAAYVSGSVNDAAVSAKGALHIRNGGTVEDIKVAANGKLYISNGGILTGSASLNAAGSVVVYNGGKIDFDITDRQPGATPLISNLSVITGSPSYSVSVTAGTKTGTYVLASGASEFNNTITVKDSSASYGTISVDGSALSYNSKKYSLLKDGDNLSLKIEADAYIKIYSSGTLTSQANTVNGETLKAGLINSMYISRGGIARNTKIQTGGYVRVYKDGEISATSVYANGTLNIDGGAAYGIDVNAGKLYAGNGAVLSNTVVSNKGVFNLEIGNAEKNTVTGGSAYVSSGAVFSSNTLKNDAVLHVYSKGTVQDTVLDTGAEMYLSAHAKHKGSLQINNNAAVTAYTDSVIDFTIAGRSASAGYLINNLALITGSPTYTITIKNDQAIGVYKLAQGASAFSGTIDIVTDLSNYGSLTVNGAALNHGGKSYSLIKAGGNLTLNIGSLLEPTGKVALYSSGTLTARKDQMTGEQLKAGGNNSMYVSSGGTACHTTISDGGVAYIRKDGKMSSTVLNNGGKMYVSNGGLHEGTLQIKTGASVQAYAGAVFDFTIAGRTASDGYLINNLSLISGSPTYTITIQNDQSTGIYKLAQGASSLTGAITLQTDTADLGSLTINGDPKIIEGRMYDLNNVDGSLTLSVSVPPSFTAGRFNGVNGVFEFSGNSTACIHTGSGKKTIAGTLDASAWELIGAGDFNKSGNSGLLWQEIATGKLYVQNDLTSFNEVNNKTNYFDTVQDGHEILAVGDFSGTGYAGTATAGVAYKGSSGSLNQDLIIRWNDAGGIARKGVQGTLVHTWKTGDALKGNTSNAADINAKNYSYDVIASGDYNGDGIDDFVVQNVMPASVDGVNITGSNDLYAFMSGDIKSGERPSIAYIGHLDNGWKLEGSGDFNGDGADDLLFSKGMLVSVWKLSDGQLSGKVDVGYSTANNMIVGIADLNNDGTDDIIFCNRNTGACTGWKMRNYANTQSMVIA